MTMMGVATICADAAAGDLEPTSGIAAHDRRVLCIFMILTAVLGSLQGYLFARLVGAPLSPTMATAVWVRGGQLIGQLCLLCMTAAPSYVHHRTQAVLANFDIVGRTEELNEFVMSLKSYCQPSSRPSYPRPPPPQRHS